MTAPVAGPPIGHCCLQKQLVIAGMCPKALLGQQMFAAGADHQMQEIIFVSSAMEFVKSSSSTNLNLTGCWFTVAQTCAKRSSKGWKLAVVTTSKDEEKPQFVLEQPCFAGFPAAGNQKGEVFFLLQLELVRDPTTTRRERT